MHRTNRIALLAALVLLLVAAGSVLGTRVPDVGVSQPAPQTTDHEDEPAADDEAPPTAEDLAHAGTRLEASGVSVDAAVLGDLASRYGTGGAVRLYAWQHENENGASLEDLAAMRDAGMGWGQIARELGVHPGIGSVMGNGGGHGRESAPGQQKDRGTDD